MAHVRYVDRFGNVQLNVRHEDVAGTGMRLGHRVRIAPARGDPRTVEYVLTFADAGPGELLLYEDAQRGLALAVSHGDAAASLGLGPDDQLSIRPA